MLAGVGHPPFRSSYSAHSELISGGANEPKSMSWSVLLLARTKAAVIA